MALAVILALGAALSYGVSDFFGGTAATRLRVIPTTLISYGAGTVAYAVLVLLTGGQWSIEVVFWGAIAGVAAVLGFVTFYAAMAVGPMSLVSPLIAVISAGIPVAAAVALGERLTAWAWLGVVLALLAAVLISAQPRKGGRRLSMRAAVLSVVSAVSLGSAVIALDRAPIESASISGLVEIGLGVALLGVVWLIGRLIAPAGRSLANLGGPVTGAGTPARNVMLAVAAGVLLALANAALIAALQSGSLAIVSVLVGLYPIATLLLARVLGGERMTPVQLTGAALAVAASAILGLSLAG